jgi:hypothetical protein
VTLTRLATGGTQGGEQVPERALELLDDPVADDLVVGVQRGLTGEEHHLVRGTGHRV